MSLLITVRRKSVIRRFWRELYALIPWGIPSPIYGDFAAPLRILGHEGFSVSARKRSHEVEISFFEPMPELQDSDAMRREMREAVAEVARRHGYTGVYWRNRNPSPFLLQQQRGSVR